MATTQDAHTSEPAWHTLNVSEALQHEEVDPATGLSHAEADRRLQTFGPNAFAQAKKQPGYIRFLDQYRDPMQIVLLVAAVVSIVIREWSTALLLIVLTLFNAFLALRQEGKAEASVAALQKMLIVRAKVRRDGQVIELPAEQIAILGIALAAYLGTIAVHSNGFIAAFVGGLAFGAATHLRFLVPTAFTETLSTVLSVVVWVICGAILLPLGMGYVTDWRPILYAILSLTVVRMLPVAVALVGTHLRPDTIAVMGWFGPRGLASVVFTLLAFDQLQRAGRPIDTLLTVATVTIAASVLAHGLSAQPIAAWYARRLSTADDNLIELVDVPEVPARHSIYGGT